MTQVVTEISNEQAQKLMDSIINQCEKLGLEPTQILDGIARSLLGATIAFGTKELTVDIEKQGLVQVKVFEENKKLD